MNNVVRRFACTKDAHFIVHQVCFRKLVDDICHLGIVQVHSAWFDKLWSSGYWIAGKFYALLKSVCLTFWCCGLRDSGNARKCVTDKVCFAHHTEPARIVSKGADDVLSLDSTQVTAKKDLCSCLGVSQTVRWKRRRFISAIARMHASYLQPCTSSVASLARTRWASRFSGFFCILIRLPLS